jgi:hypothetical protein
MCFYIFKLFMRVFFFLKRIFLMVHFVEKSSFFQIHFGSESARIRIRNVFFSEIRIRPKVSVDLALYVHQMKEEEKRDIGVEFNCVCEIHTFNSLACALLCMYLFPFLYFPSHKPHIHTILSNSSAF